MVLMLFIAELALIAITKGDFDRARYHVNRFYQQFTADWASLHPLATAGRHLKLQSLQKVRHLLLPSVMLGYIFISSITGAIIRSSLPLLWSSVRCGTDCVGQVTELEEFLDFLGEEKNFLNTKHLDSLISSWRKRYVHLLDGGILLMLILFSGTHQPSSTTSTCGTTW